MKKVLVVLLVTVLVLGFLSSCKKNDAVDTGDNDNSGNNGNTPASGYGVGNIALAFTETTSLDTEFSLEDFNGKVILLNFSAMWCSPCIAEAPELMELYNTYKEQGLEIVQCLFQDELGEPADITDMGRWIEDFGITFTVIGDTDSSTVEAYNFSSIPFNVIIGRDMVITYRAAGFDKESVVQAIEAAL